MLSSRRRQLVLLGLLLVGLAVVIERDLATSAAPPPVPAGSRAARAARATPARTTAPPEVEALRLDVLDRARAAPSEPGRDLFQRGVEREQVPAASAAGTVAPAPMPASMVPAGPPMPPPIALKFVGIVHPAHQAQIAVLSDGRNVFYGREGETIDGRYRIERIGVESIEMAWVDGRGRQVIRLSGS